MEFLNGVDEAETFLSIVASVIAISGLAFAAGVWRGRSVCADATRGLRTAKAELNAFKKEIQAAAQGEIFIKKPVATAERTLSEGVREGPRVIAVCNLKGGVGKTTLAANLGAYFADQQGQAHQRKRVLFIDLDFQGSLSATLALTLGEPPENRAWGVFGANATVDGVVQSIRPLPHERFAGCGFLDAALEIATLEEQLKFDWALGKVDSDARFKLARLLASDKVRELYDLVVIDCPPRQTMLTINALCAATHAFIPTRLDALSGNGVELFVSSLDRSKARLWPNLKMGAVVACMTNKAPGLTPTEEAFLADVQRRASRAWGEPVSILRDRVENAHIPNKVDIANAAGQSFAYFDNNPEVSSIFSRVGEAAAMRLGYLNEP